MHALYAAAELLVLFTAIFTFHEMKHFRLCIVIFCVSFFNTELLNNVVLSNVTGTSKVAVFWCHTSKLCYLFADAWNDAETATAVDEIQVLRRSDDSTAKQSLECTLQGYGWKGEGNQIHLEIDQDNEMRKAGFRHQMKMIEITAENRARWTHMLGGLRFTVIHNAQVK